MTNRAIEQIHLLGDEPQGVIWNDIQLDFRIHPVLCNGRENLVVHSLSNSHGETMVSSVIKRVVLLGGLLLKMLLHLLFLMAQD